VNSKNRKSSAFTGRGKKGQAVVNVFCPSDVEGRGGKWPRTDLAAPRQESTKGKQGPVKFCISQTLIEKREAIRILFDSQVAKKNPEGKRVGKK